MILPLPHNPIPVYYSGGEQIRAYRGVGMAGGVASPEDWLGSTTVLDSPGGYDIGAEVGESLVADGRTVSQVIAEDVASWVGREAEPGGVDFLVKLLDPAERIPVHWHPNADFASTHLGMTHGKAEAWIVLSPNASVWLGLVPGTRVEDLSEAIDAQDHMWMLENMHELDLVEGDTVFVPPGLIHAIDAGALIAEIQEPTSVSILAEHERLGIGRQEAALWAGWTAALACLIAPRAMESIKTLIGRVPEAGNSRLFPEESYKFFRSWVVNVEGEAEVLIDRLSVALVDRGPISISDGTSGNVDVALKGSGWLVGQSTRLLLLKGSGRLLLFSGPSHHEPTDIHGAVN